MGSSAGTRAGNRNLTAGGKGPLTAGQLDAVNSNASRIAVVAGPGSGKTRVLVERVQRRVNDGRLDLARTLAITFTENAAAEMKTRLAEAFDKSGQAQHRQALERAYISTIHSFCARLLREHAIEAGVDPRFEVLDEVHSAVLKKVTLDAVLNEWGERRPEEYLEFARHMKGEFAESLAKIYDTARRLGCDPQDRNKLLKPSPESFSDVLAQVEAELERLKRSPAKAVNVAGISALLRRLAADKDPLAALETAQRALARIGKQRIGDLRTALKKLRASALDLCASVQRRRVAELLAEVDREYRRRKQRLSALDFEDLEQLALRLLESSPELLRRIGERFQEILVDEYQDTSPVQSEMIELLGRHSRLFVVGDPFQSIYGFRNADPTAFLRMWDEAAPERQGGIDGRVPLREDFRSRPEIIQAVNLHFEHSFAGLQPAFTSLAAGSAFEEKREPSIELLLLAPAERDAFARRAVEARHLARRIREIVEQKQLRFTAIERGPEETAEAVSTSKEDCPIGYGDIALLFRSTPDIPIYERALQEEGVPYFAETGRGFYGAREVRDVVSFLRVLDNSRNDIAVAAVLRSPMFGVSDDALLLLAAHARSQPNLSLIDAVEQVGTLAAMPAGEGARIREFQEVLARLRDEQPWRPLPDLVREIVRATSLESTLLLGPNGRRESANVHKLADVAASLVKAGFESLRDFVAAVDRFHFEEVREGEAQLDTAAEGAVRLMTMHAAKGLEFPVVVLPDLGRGTGGDSPQLDFLPHFGIGVHFVCGHRPETTLTLENIRQDLKARDEKERQRVLFVAWTRAREHLILSGSLDPGRAGFKPKKALAEICSTFGIASNPVTLSRCWTEHEVRTREGLLKIRVLATDEVLPQPSPLEGPIAERYRQTLMDGGPLGIPVEAEAEIEARRLIDAARAPLPESDSSDFLAAATDVLEFGRCPRRYYLGRYLGHDSQLRRPRVSEVESTESIEEDEPGDEMPRTELGLVVHRTLAAGPESLAALPPEVRAQVEPLARRFWDSDIGKRLGGAEKPVNGARRELPLMAQVDGRFLRGTLDLLTFAEGRPDLLLDYKANDIAADEVPREAETYRIQMLLYALLVEAAFGALPREAVLFFLKPGLAHTVALTPEALQEARGALEAFFTAQRTLTYPPLVGDHCLKCAFNGTLCQAPRRVVS